MFQRFDPFTEMDRLAGALAGRSALTIPIDAYRSGDHVVLHLDLPGVDPGSIDVTVERGVLSVHAERTPRPEEGVHWLARERFSGPVDKQLALGDALDTDTLTATYDAGVLTLTVLIAQRAKPRKITVGVSNDRQSSTGQLAEPASASAAA